ncbi:MAG: porphobilinogen synthase, partial [Desulfonatronovibrionaceae bacterium]
SFYGPFRDAAQSSPQFGDRKSYQMDPANSLEAVREARADRNEGADILMVKPAMPYLDVLRRLRDNIDLPLAAYQVSGEYSMLKAAALQGWLDEKEVVLESLTGIKRAGAGLILSYFTEEVLGWV